MTLQTFEDLSPAEDVFNILNGNALETEIRLATQGVWFTDQATLATVPISASNTWTEILSTSLTDGSNSGGVTMPSNCKLYAPVTGWYEWASVFTFASFSGSQAYEFTASVNGTPYDDRQRTRRSATTTTQRPGVSANGMRVFANEGDLVGAMVQNTGSSNDFRHRFINCGIRLVKMA